MAYRRGDDPMEDQKHEKPRQVFDALLDVAGLSGVSKQVQAEFLLRWQEAEGAERRLRHYNEEWDRSLLGVHRYGQ